MVAKTEKIIERLSLTFKILAGLMFFAGLFGYLVSSLISILARNSPLGRESLFELSAPLAFVFKHIGVLSAGQVILAGFIFYASVQLSKFQEWAREALEFVVWFLLAVAIGIGAFSIAVSPLSVSVFLKSLLTASAVFWTIPLLIIVWFIRKKEVREVFKKGVEDRT